MGCFVLALWPVGLAAGGRSCDGPAALARPGNCFCIADGGWLEMDRLYVFLILAGQFCP